MLNQPLADKIRPRTLGQIVGQDHLLGTGGILRSLFERRLAQSMQDWLLSYMETGS